MRPGSPRGARGRLGGEFDPARARVCERCGCARVRPTGGRGWGAGPASQRLRRAGGSGAALRTASAEWGAGLRTVGFGGPWLSGPCSALRRCAAFSFFLNKNYSSKTKNK